MAGIRGIFNPVFQNKGKSVDKKDSDKNVDKDNRISIKKAAISGLSVLNPVVAAGVSIYESRPSKFSQVEFRDGIALKDGKVFNGVVSDNLKNGDRIKIQYAEGLPVYARRRGEKSFVKTYTTEGSDKYVHMLTPFTDNKINLSEKARNAVTEKEVSKPEDFVSNSEPVQTERSTKKSNITDVFDDKGNLKERITNTENGTKINEYFNENGDVVYRIASSDDSEKPEFKTTYSDDAKIVEMQKGDNIYGKKIYVLKDGKFRKNGREIIDISNNQYKKAEYMNDGSSKTTIRNGEDETVIYRDKKGNIISVIEDFDDDVDDGSAPDSPDVVEQKEYEVWYMNYLGLCRKFGCTSLSPSAGSGAWTHYNELCIREKGGEEWDDYLKNEELRAQYDDKARLARFRREFGGTDLFKNAGFSEEDIQTLICADPKTLRKLFDAVNSLGLSPIIAMHDINLNLKDQLSYGFQDAETAVNDVLNKYNVDVSSQINASKHACNENTQNPETEKTDEVYSENEFHNQTRDEFYDDDSAEYDEDYDEDYEYGAEEYEYENA